MKRYVKSAIGSESLKKYDEAREKSIQLQRLVKVFRGVYYYKGWWVRCDGGPSYPWNATDERKYGDGLFHDADDKTMGRTLREVLDYIDAIMEYEE